MRYALLLINLFTINLFAQQLPDPLYLYEQHITPSTNPIFIGKVDPLASKSRSTHPFFETRGWQQTMVSFNGVIHKDLESLYDINRGVLILKYPDPNKVIGVLADMRKIENFEIGDNVFRRPLNASKENFFEVLFEGQHLNFLVDRSKTEVTTSSEVTYRDLNTYYLEINNKLKKLENRKTLKQTLTNYKEISARVKALDSNLKYSKYNEDMLVSYMKAVDEVSGE